MKTSDKFTITINVTINVRTRVTLTEAEVAFSVTKKNTGVY